MARTAGAAAVLMAREGSYAQIRLRSGEVRRVHIECRATVGEVGNAEQNLRKLGKQVQCAGVVYVQPYVVLS